MLKSRYKEVFSYTPEGIDYHFLPEAMNGYTEGKAVLRWLDQRSERLAEQLYRELVEDAFQNTIRWTGLLTEDSDTVHEAIRGMRNFWNDQLEPVLANHLQDLLMCYMTGDPNAKFDPNDPDATAQLHAAAERIYHSLLGSAGLMRPMLFTNHRLSAEDLAGRTYLMVPRGAKELLHQLEVVVDDNYHINQVYVCTSHCCDTITAYRHFTAVPAFLLEWTQQAEREYEACLATPMGYGIHLSPKLRDLPSLLPQSTWQRRSYNLREEVLANKAAELFARARRFPGLTVRTSFHGGGSEFFTVSVLPEELRCPAAPDASSPEAHSERELALEKAQRLARCLFENGEFHSRESIVRTLTTMGIPWETWELRNAPVLSYHPPEKTPDTWCEDLAATLLRKLPNVMTALEGTLPVLEALADLVNGEA